MVNAQWCDEQEGANHWCAFNELADDHEVQHVLCADVKMHPISDDNKLPTSCDRDFCVANGAMKVDLECHEFVVDEMERREHYEYDPSQVIDDQGE